MLNASSFLNYEICFICEYSKGKKLIHLQSMLCDDEIDELQEHTIFKPHEIKHLFERFKCLDRSQNGFISFNDLMMLPEFHSNPLSGLILNSIEETLNFENMTFPYFLEILQIFNRRMCKKERIKFLFKAFDIKKDGKLCREVLSKLFQIINGDKCDRLIMDAEVAEVLKQYDQGNKGYLNYKDFSRFYHSDVEIDMVLIIDLESEL